MRGVFILLLIVFTTDLDIFCTNPPLFSNTHLSYNELSKPRPRFRKNVFAYNTFFVEGCFVNGYYNAQKYSINYDYTAQESNNTSLTLRIGYEKVRMNSGPDRSQIPMFVNILFGRKNYFELSGGALYDLSNNKINPVFATGYRHQNPKGGFFLRLNVFITNEKEIDPIQKLELKRIWVFGPGLGLGWSF